MNLLKVSCKNILAIVLLLISVSFLQSCGFRPVLAKNSAGSRSISEVRIASVTGREHERNQQIIEKLFNNKNNNTKYSLKINYNYGSSSVGVMKDSQITRYRLNANLDYTLLTSADEKVVASGSIALSGAYDASNSDFANFVAERSVSDQLVDEMIRELKIRLSFIIANQEENNESSYQRN